MQYKKNLAIRYDERNSIERSTFSPQWASRYYRAHSLNMEGRRLEMTASFGYQYVRTV